MHRCLERPVFIFSPVRSGSTLLRAILDRHSQLYAPHELHLKDLRVEPAGPLVRQSMAAFGLDARELEHLLWDRLMGDLLRRSGKRIFVNKTPTDVFIRDRIAACWPDARYVFLLRNPAAVAASWHRVQVHWTFEQAVEDVLRYATAVEAARRELPGPSLTYEELTEVPETAVRRVCDFIGVPWEPGMLEYGRRDFRPGIGDGSEKIHSGRPLSGRPPPAEIPPALVGVSRSWGYETGR